MQFATAQIYCQFAWDGWYFFFNNLLGFFQFIFDCWLLVRKFQAYGFNCIIVSVLVVFLVYSFELPRLHKLWDALKCISKSYALADCCIYILVRSRTYHTPFSTRFSRTQSTWKHHLKAYTTNSFGLGCPLWLIVAHVIDVCVCVLRKTIHLKHLSIWRLSTKLTENHKVFAGKNPHARHIRTHTHTE